MIDAPLAHDAACAALGAAALPMPAPSPAAAAARWRAPAPRPRSDRRAARWPALLLAALPLQAPAAEPATDGVTIYRCADSRGRVVGLRDSPCPPGERQQVLQMQRPQDPPPRPAPAASPAPASALEPQPPRDVRVIAVQAPQPMYECTTPEGERYTSDDGQGHPRWVPFWTVGYGHRPHRPYPPRPPVGTPGPGPGPAPPAGMHGPRWPPPHPGHGVAVPAGGAWVRDSCVRLSQEEICSHLSDRRYEILRLYHAAMPSRRQALDREQRQIDARMNADCPGY